MIFYINLTKKRKWEQFKNDINYFQPIYNIP